MGVVHLHEAELGRAPPHKLLAQAGEVNLADAAGVDEVEQVVAVTHSVHGVGHRRVKAERACGGLAVERVGGAGQGGGTQRAEVGRGAGVLHASEVTAEHPEVGQQVVREQHGLGRLHVGVAGHDDAKLLVGTLEQHTLQLGERLEQLVGQIARNHVRVDGRLVVAGTAGVEATAGSADALGKHTLDGHVDVLVAVHIEDEGASLNLGSNLVEALADGLGIFLGDDTLVGQHGGMGLGAADVLAPHAFVKRQRSAKALELAGGRGTETAAPQRLWLRGLAGLVLSHGSPYNEARPERPSWRSGRPLVYGHPMVADSTQVSRAVAEVAELGAATPGPPRSQRRTAPARRRPHPAQRRPWRSTPAGRRARRRGPWRPRCGRAACG